MYSACKMSEASNVAMVWGFFFPLSVKWRKKEHLLSAQAVSVIISHCRDFNCDQRLTFPRWTNCNEGLKLHIVGLFSIQFIRAWPWEWNPKSCFRQLGLNAGLGRELRPR